MTRVCLVGKEAVELRPELLAYETARSALSTYDLDEPYANSVAVETISLGTAASLLGDLDWYLARLVDEALVLEPSVDETEWLSRRLATAVRDGDRDPEETGDLLKVYGVEYGPRDAGGDGASGDGATGGDSAEADDSADDAGGGASDGGASGDSGPPARTVTAGPTTGRLVEPMYVRRVDGAIPEYDLRDVAETLVVRVADDEFR